MPESGTTEPTTCHHAFSALPHGRASSRSLVKAGNGNALAILGYTEAPQLHLRNIVLNSKEVRIGESVRVSFAVELLKPTNILVDLRLHYLKADGTHSPKVFKLGEVNTDARLPLDCA